MFRSLIALVALTLAVPAAAFAQTAPAPQDAPPAAAGAPGSSAPAARRHHGRYLAAVRALALSPEQQQQIRGFVRDTRAANQGADPATKHANTRKMRSEIEAVLTPDQRTQLHAAMVQASTNNSTR
jgi:Spy/CpxP family protein refolding chaperone